MRKFVLAVLLAIPMLGMAQNSFYSDRAVGTFPMQNGVSTLVPIQYGQVRVCTSPLSQQSPCLPLASITDLNNVPLTVSGGNFGQLTTSVTGQFSFGCAQGNYVIQVAAASNNVPQLQYNITCPVDSVTLAGTFSGVGTVSCTNQFPRQVTLNGGAAPTVTCSAVAPTDATGSTTGSGNFVLATGPTIAGASLTGDVTVSSGNIFAWGSSGLTAPDVGLYRSAANELGVNQGSGTPITPNGFLGARHLTLYNSVSGSVLLDTGVSGGSLTVNKPVDATTGFRIGGAAPSGHTIVGNGTNYVDGTIGQSTVTNGYVDLGTNQTVGGNKTFTGNTSMAGISSTKAYRDARLDGVVCDGVTEDGANINTAIANAVTNQQSIVLLPAGSCKVSTSINLTNKSSITLQGAGSNQSPQVGLESYADTNTNVTTILCNTGNICVDRVGSSYSSLKQLNLVIKNAFATPSTVAMAMGRDNGGSGTGATNPFCYGQFNSDDHIFIATDHNAVVNGGRGYIGIYEIGAELYTLSNSFVMADLGMWSDVANTLAISSAYQTIQTGCPSSMEGITVTNTSFTAESSASSAAIIFNGSPNGLHTFVSGLCQPAVAGNYCFVLGSGGTGYYGLKIYPAFTVEGATASAGAGGVLFSNNNLSDSVLDASTAIPSGSLNGWYQVANTGITFTDTVLKIHKINAGDTAEPLISNVASWVFKGGELQLATTASPLSVSNVTLTGTRVVAGGFTDANITFNSGSKFILQDDSGVSLRGILSSYNSVSLVGNGLSTTVFQDDRTGQSATIGPITMVTGSTTTGGHYHLCQNQGTTATDASGATYAITFNWTSDGLGRSIAGGALNLTSTGQQGSFCIAANADASTNITYTVTVTGAPTTGRFAQHVWAAKE